MLKWLQDFRRSFFDVRDGEFGRAIFVTLYLLFILFAYYILKPVSRAMFVAKFDLDKLPGLYILIAPAGGLLAYVYSRLAVKASLTAAVNAATAFSIAMTALIGYLIRFRWDWTLYAFNIWTSMFSIMMVTQGWVIAANVFTSREAKRLYGLLGLGSVIGAAFGGTFTAYAVKAIGTNNLVLAAAFFTFCAYLMYRMLLRQPGVDLSRAQGAASEEEFSIRDILKDIRHYRHLQVIVGIVLMTFIVDVMVEFQFQAFAKERFPTERELTAFMGSFNGIYLNLVNFVFQFFLTAAVVRWVGVGGVLQIMPVAISAASIGILAAPGVLTTSIARLTEAATRYTFNRTGMELLYLPLPLELRNRVKAFLDIFVDRMGRGLGGLLLQLFTVVLGIRPKQLSLVILCFTAVWAFLSWLAQREYVLTIRRRLETRTLDLASVRVSATDRAVIKLLEETARGSNGRQASYALTMLGTVEGYDIAPLIEPLSKSLDREVRATVFRIAQEKQDRALLPQALQEIRSSRAGDTSPAVEPAVRYATGLSPDGEDLAVRLLDHPSILVAEAALESLLLDQERARTRITVQTVTEGANSDNPDRRRLAAIAVRAIGDEGTPILHTLLADSDSRVAEAALESAGKLRKRAYLDHVIQRLGDTRLRAVATDALAAYGPMIAGTLRDLLEDPEVKMAIRLRIPRALERMKEQRAADELLDSIGIADLTVRASVLRSLGRMREAAPNLSFGPPVVDRHILDEAKYYFVLWAAFEPFLPATDGSKPLWLLTSTLEDRLKNTLQRLFYLLGLKYSPRDMREAYDALQRKSADDHAAAIDFLDSVLNRELKRVLLPLVDDTAKLSDRGRELFGIERKTPETALRELLHSGDVWLVCCAIAAAADLKLRSLKADISAVSADAGREVGLVAERALQAIA
jgi:AAA family ATP:ADP antiporter